MKINKSIPWFLGVSMFMFGTLKFFNPFKEWYTVQITNSGFGEVSYIMGIAGEIAVGLTLILCMIFKNSIPSKLYSILISAASFTIIVIMATGIYVHLHPDVPAEVLPLGIKPPYIPGIFMALAVTNIYFARKVSIAL